MDGVEGVGEGFVVAGVGDDDIALRDVGQGGGLYQMGFKGIKPELLLGGDEELGGIDMGIGLLEGGALLGGDAVGLVEEEEEGLVFEGRGKREEGRVAEFALLHYQLSIVHCQL